MYAPQTPSPNPVTNQNLISIIGRILVLLILIGALIYVVSMVFGCNTIPVPGYCDFWYEITTAGGRPIVLIVYGNEGLGNPEALEIALNNPKQAAARTKMLEVSRISSGVLNNYSLVIVTKSKKMTAAQLQMFMDYVNFGGNLVWTGDAGTDFPVKENETKIEAMKRELLYEFEDPEQDSNSDKSINVWARKYEGNTVRFDKFISASFKGNYCDLFPKNCEGNELPLIGSMEKIESEHKTVLGIRNGLKIYGNLALVNLINSTTTSLIADVGSKKEFGNESRNPLIIQSGFGGRVLYYSIPVEELINEKIPFDAEGNPQTAPSLIQKMYEASIK
jgi:hypothetical protein